MQNKEFSKKEVIRVLTYPNKLIVNVCLLLVNLNKTELKILELIYFYNFTEEEVSEQLNYSRSTIQRKKKKALQKCSVAWGRTKLIDEILKDLRRTNHEN